jgi:hypothetical protein
LQGHPSQQITNRNIVNADDLAAYPPSLSNNALHGADTLNWRAVEP